MNIFHRQIGCAGKHILIVFILVVVAIVSFMLGRLSITPQESNIIVSLPNGDQVAATALQNLSLEDQNKAVEESFVVASKSGAKYHYPWCGGAKTISENNKIIFPTNSAAREAGYEPAKNCKGLE